MRYTEFLEKIDFEFGPSARVSMLEDHIFFELGSISIPQAIKQGEELKDIWLGICREFNIPVERR